MMQITIKITNYSSASDNPQPVELSNVSGRSAPTVVLKLDGSYAVVDVAEMISALQRCQQFPPLGLLR